MATTTPNNGWPVPTSTDLVTLGATAIKSLGDSIDSDIAAGLKQWISWTPTISGGFTVGNGVFSNARYCKIGKNIHYSLVFTLGSTSVAGTLNISLPVAAQVVASQMFTGYCNAGGTAYSLAGRMNTTTTITVFAQGSAGTYVNLANIAAAVPGVWVNGNIISINGTYEQA